MIARIVENADVLVGNEEDLQKGLGIPGPEVAAKSKLDPSAFFGMIDKVIAKHPQVKVVATTLRDVHSTNRHSWSAVAWIDGKTYTAPTCELDVLDRVGGGDAFASGFFYGLLAGESPEEAVRLGWAHGALVTTFPGDTTMATLEQVGTLAKGGSASHVIQLSKIRNISNEKAKIITMNEKADLGLVGLAVMGENLC